jgi:hypothetical protein
MKMKSNESKQCVVCGKIYHPEKRTAKRQKVCDDLKCKTEYKNNYNEQWRKHKENVNYFKGRYPNLQEWLENHPDYLKNYRLRKKTEAQQESCDIQVKLTDYNNNGLSQIKLLSDIQVELNTNINNKKRQLIQLLSPDIQVQLTESYYNT